MAVTPGIRLRGRYILKTPWVANPGKVYECEAIRSFDDLAKLGVDPYETFYLPAGLVNGQPYDSVTFSFDAERQADANIVTLRSDDGEYLYVPDTYILSIPNMGGVKYDQVVLSVNLSAIPGYLDLSPLKTDLANRVSQIIGISTTVEENRVASSNQPSSAAHDAAEAARTAAISVFKTDHMLLQEALVRNTQLQATVNALVAKLQALGAL